MAFLLRTLAVVRAVLAALLAAGQAAHAQSADMVRRCYGGAAALATAGGLAFQAAKE
jgi:hypothetical protein